ncbi:MAG: substrate-binding domain-containing protein [Sedimenticola sp.]
MQIIPNPISHFLCRLLVGLSLCAPVFAQATQPVMGAGPSTAVVTFFFRHFNELPASGDYRFTVEPHSIKHAGGIRASDKYLFGRSGRPLKTTEKALGKEELFLARIPLAIVVGKEAGVERLSLMELEAIFTGKITNWKELGGKDHPIHRVGREASEAAFGVLKRDYPFFEQALFERVFNRDHQVVNFLASPKGDYAISFGARNNFDPQYLLEVEDFQSGINLGLIYDIKNSHHPVVRAAIDYAQSEAWVQRLMATDFLPPRARVLPRRD